MPHIAIGNDRFDVTAARAEKIKLDIIDCAKHDRFCTLTFVDETGRESWAIWTPGTPIVINDWPSH